MAMKSDQTISNELILKLVTTLVHAHRGLHNTRKGVTAKSFIEVVSRDLEPMYKKALLATGRTGSEYAATITTMPHYSDTRVLGFDVNQK